MTDPTTAIADYWDAAAPVFDAEPDHGLHAEQARTAWSRLLRSCLPSTPSNILDVGCGTGSLSLLLAEDGHHITGVDLAPKMLQLAQEKLTAAGLPGRFLVGDAANPPTGEERFDALVSRHLIWTLLTPKAALREWITRIRPNGTLVLIEGRWRESGQSGVPYVAGAESLPWHNGVSSTDLAAAVRPLVAELRVETLSDNPDLWGGPVTDERYALIARTRSTGES